jgi:hypothetical protein
MDPTPTKAWLQKGKPDLYIQQVNRGPLNPPDGVDPDLWRCAWEKREPTPEAARIERRERWEDWLMSDDDTPPPSVNFREV